MKWYNEPPVWETQDNRLLVKSGPKTDFWRKTHYGFIRDNGHFYSQDVTGDFVAGVKLSGNYNALYDQAGLMVRLDDRVWLKFGIEYVGGVQNLSVVVTRDFSDWSVVPVPHTPPTVWLRLIRRAETVETHYSIDGSAYTMVRLAYLSTEETLSVGMMCAAPEGDGFDATFEDFTVHML
ncbi:MAG: DUF1349 domain-containing protein [Anaerolineae bacterium]|nr:DUF1349 domain-containing protein [Anaerolineae bacterium]